jgi:hypothetical protein
MQISIHVEALQHDLAAVASIGDAEATETVRRIGAALESSLRLRLLDVITEVAHELSGQLPSGRVEVRLAGGEPTLVFVEEAPEPTPSVGEDAFTARITLRLPEALKSSVEALAAREGMSVNAWIVQAIARNTSPRSPRSGRLTGFARS